MEGEFSLSFGLTAAGASGTVGGGGVTLSYGLAVETYNAGPLAFAYGLTGAGVSGSTLESFALTLPPAGLTAASLPGGVLQGSFALPPLDLLARLGTLSDLTFAFGLNATATGGGVATFAEPLAALTLSAVGQNAIYLAGSPLLPLPALSASMLVGSAGGLAVTLPTISLTATGSGGVSGLASFSLPALGLQGEAYTTTQISGGFSLPYGLRADNIALSPFAQLSGAAFAMTARTGALTTYTNFGFNSFARFGGKNLAIGANGLYELTGRTDAGAVVNARVRGTVNDAGLTQAKRLLSAFCGYRANGSLELRVRADQQGPDNVYTLPPQETGLYRNRVKFGRGAVGSYWEWEVRNLGGASFELDVIELETVALPRKRA